MNLDDILIRIEAAAREAAAPGARERADASAPRGALPLVVLAEEADPQAERVSLALAGAREARPFRVRDHELLGDEDFVRCAYLAILRRPADPASLADLSPRLGGGHLTRTELASALSGSAEGRKAGTPVKGRGIGRLLRLARRVPGLGGAVLRATRLVRAERALKQLESRFAGAEEQARRSLARDRAIASGTNAAILAVRGRLSEMEASLSEAERLAREAAGRADALSAARASLREQSIEIRRVLDEAARAGGLAAAAASDPAAVAGAARRGLDDLYLAFEDRFRGSREEIRERQRRYVGLVRDLEPVRAGAVVLDVGCGRGEWLRLLVEAGIAAEGVDLNAAMVETARAAGLEAELADGIARLEAAAPGSLGAVSAFHVVEHLGFEDLVRLVDAAHRALAPGGAILFETPNPENLVVGACTFHLDPTHVRPLPPDFLSFVAHARGFASCRIIRTERDCDLGLPESGFAPTGIEDWFRAVPDYALFAEKAAQ